MSALAKRVLELDRKHPGDPEAPMELPAKLWAELVELARAESTKRCHRCEAERTESKLQLVCIDQRGCTRRDRHVRCDPKPTRPT